MRILAIGDIHGCFTACEHLPKWLSTRRPTAYFGDTRQVYAVVGDSCRVSSLPRR